MTARKVYLEPTGPLNHLWRPSFSLANPELLKPSNASAGGADSALIDGEWLTLNSARKLVRAADLTQAAGTASSKRGFLWWEELGRYDVQAIQQGNILFTGHCEFNTLVFDGTGISDCMTPLMTGVVVVDGIKRSGLLLRTGSNPIVGYVTKLPANNGGKLQFILGY